MRNFCIHNKWKSILLLLAAAVIFIIYIVVPILSPSQFANAKPSGADWGGGGPSSCGCSCDNMTDSVGNHVGGTSAERGDGGDGSYYVYTPPPPPPPPPPTLVFIADSYRLQIGTATMLRWDSEHTVSCTASGGTSEWSGVKSADGSGSSGVLTLDPTTFTLTCTGRGGSVSKDVTVRAYEEDDPKYCGDSICSLGESCDTCSTDCGICSGPYCGDGVCQSSTETCATCSNDCGVCSIITSTTTPTTTPTTTITTTTTTFDLTHPTLTFWPSGNARTDNTKTISSGDTVYLNWDTTNSTRCTAGPGWSGSMATSGRNVNAGILTSDSFFGLACYDGSGRDDYKTVAINVQGGSEPLKINSFEVYPPIVRRGNSAKVSWDIENATTCTIVMEGDAEFTNPGSIRASDSALVSNIKSELKFTLQCEKVDNNFSPPDITSENAEVKIRLAPNWLEQ